MLNIGISRKSSINCNTNKCLSRVRHCWRHCTILLREIAILLQKVVVIVVKIVEGIVKSIV